MLPTMRNVMQASRAILAWLSRRRLLLGIIALLVAVYGGFGYWIAPGIAREQIVKNLSEALQRKVTLERVRIDPFALSVKLSTFVIEETGGEPIIAFDELYVNFSSTSVIRFAWTFSEIRLTRPRIALVIRPDGSLNLAALGSKAPKEKAADGSATGLPRVMVGQLSVIDGQVAFADRRGKQFQTSVDAISFSLDEFSTLPDNEGQHVFNASTDLGAKLAWRGRLGVNPLQSEGHLELTGIRVPRLTAYLLPEAVKVTEGIFDLGADYAVKLRPAGTELSVTGGRIALRGVRATLMANGRSLTPLNLEFSPVALNLSGFLGHPGSRATVALDITPNGAGTIAARGTLGLDPLVADMQIAAADVALAPFQTFLDPYARLQIERGAVHVKGRVELGAGKKGGVRFTGSGGISDLSVVDTVQHQGFTRWRSLEFEDIRVMSGASLSIARIVAQDPYLRFGIGPDRVTNLQHILGKGQDVKQSEARAPQPEAKAPASASPAMRIGIGQITVRNGSANFADQSLRPAFSTGLQELTGAITGLSSENDARAKVALRGKVDRYAPATIEGEINPLAAQAYTDIALHFENIDLTTYTPYSGKFAGRRIDKGKLNLDLRYKLVNRELVGENKIVFDQLTLGERVESPEALDLPLQLAIAILTDSHGVIDIDLPVRGNIDDPQFSYGGLVWKALTNLIMKAITAPFKLLAAAFGGGDELGYVAFAPGSGEIGTGEQEKLDKLARALADRPALTLEIRGAVSGDSDRAALASAKLMQQVRGKDAVLSTPLSPAEKSRLLALYRKAFGGDPKPQAGTTTENETRMIELARTQLIATMPVSEDELRELARNRGLTIGDYLVTRASVSKERVFQAHPAVGAAASSDGVRSELKLAAR
jgi:hypothetical protein